MCVSISICLTINVNKVNVYYFTLRKTNFCFRILALHKMHFVDRKIIQTPLNKTSVTSKNKLYFNNWTKRKLSSCVLVYNIHSVPGFDFMPNLTAKNIIYKNKLFLYLSLSLHYGGVVSVKWIILFHVLRYTIQNENCIFC